MGIIHSYHFSTDVLFLFQNSICDTALHLTLNIFDGTLQILLIPDPNRKYRAYFPCPFDVGEKKPNLVTFTNKTEV
jgi:uncharacterized NAD-dependent epimerase/dehydratase family protein